MAPPIDWKPPMMRTGNALRTTSDSENCTPVRAPHRRPATTATTPAAAQTSAQRRRRSIPDGDGGERIVGDRAKGDSRTRRAEEEREHADQGGGHRGGEEVEAADVDPERAIGASDSPRSSPCTCVPHTVWASPSSTAARPSVARNRDSGGALTSGRSTVRSTQGRKHEHRPERDQKGKDQRRAALAHRYERQRGEEHHRSLSEVEDARRLVDEDEAQRDERVHHAREQATDEDFEEERHGDPQAANEPT